MPDEILDNIYRSIQPYGQPFCFSVFSTVFAYAKRELRIEGRFEAILPSLLQSMSLPFGRGSRVTSRGSRVTSRGSKNLKTKKNLNKKIKINNK